MPQLKQLESDVEAKVVKYAKSRGCLERKMNGPGYRGWPDRLFGYNGKIIWVEFKRPGKEPTNLQDYVHDRLERHGFDVKWVDSVADGKNLIDEFIILHSVA
jgi:hypothetical protein